MVGALGGLSPLDDSQTPNGRAEWYGARTAPALPIGAFSGPLLVSRTGTAGRTERPVTAPKPMAPLPKRCSRMKTAGLWPWKSAPAKECVTTHRPNAGALKMDGAHDWIAYTGSNSLSTRDTSRRVHREL